MRRNARHAKDLAVSKVESKAQQQHITGKDIPSFIHFWMVHHKKTYGISLLEKELGKVRSVLAGDAGDEGDLSVLVGGDFSRHVDGVWVAGRWSK